MISRCANPACNKPFHYLRGGRLYRFEGRTTAARKNLARAVYTVSPEHISVFFWLCQECSSRLSLSFDGHFVAVVPKRAFARDRDIPAILVGKFGMETAPLQGVPH